MEFFRKNPQAAEVLRGPIFEDKVVDFVLELAKVDDKPVTAGGTGAGSGDAEHRTPPRLPRRPMATHRCRSLR